MTQNFPNLTLPRRIFAEAAPPGRLAPRPCRARGPTASIAFAPPFSPAPLADLDGSRRSGEQPRGRFRRSIRRDRSVTDLLTIRTFIRCPARPPP